MQWAEQMHKPLLTSADSLEDQVTVLYKRKGRPVVADQSTGSANSLEQYKRTEDTYYSWQWDFFGPENWRKATTKKVLMGRGGVGERA